MNSKWMFFISGFMLALVLVLVYAEDPRESIACNCKDTLDAEVTTDRESSTDDKRISCDQEAQSVFATLKQADKQSESRLALEEKTVEDQDQDQIPAMSPDEAFPDHSMLSEDEIAKHEEASDAELEADLANSGMYSPVSEEYIPEPTESEIEARELEHERQIAEEQLTMEKQMTLEGEAALELDPEKPLFE